MYFNLEIKKMEHKKENIVIDNDKNEDKSFDSTETSPKEKGRFFKKIFQRVEEGVGNVIEKIKEKKFLKSISGGGKEKDQRRERPILPSDSKK